MPVCIRRLSRHRRIPAGRYLRRKPNDAQLVARIRKADHCQIGRDYFVNSRTSPGLRFRAASCSGVRRSSEIAAVQPTRTAQSTRVTAWCGLAAATQSCVFGTPARLSVATSTKVNWVPNDWPMKHHTGRSIHTCSPHSSWGGNRSLLSVITQSSARWSGRSPLVDCRHHRRRYPQFPIGRP
jgi:hypothetical protein